MISIFARSAAALAAAILFSVVPAPEAAAGVIVCGNGNLETGEGCDDGDTEATDGCNENCLVEETFPCGTGGGGALTGDASCESGLCDETEEPDTCEGINQCGNSECETFFEENCANCEADCGTCPPTTVTTSTTTTTSTDTSTTTTDTSTTTTDTSTTTTDTSTTTTTTLPIGGCCHFGSCSDVDEDYCLTELAGNWHGEGTSCDDTDLCVNCGDFCLDFGEQCDDGDTATGDGCDDECAEEQCFNCSIGQLTGDSLEPVGCFGPSFCTEDPFCAICGNNETELGEQCDDGDTESGDCCSSTCQFESAGSACPDSIFCDGAETCDGSGNCNDGPDPTCSQLNTDCVVGYCDAKLDACAPDTSENNGQSCDAGGACGSGACQNGVCVGAATTLSPTCRWIILGGSNEGDVRVRTGPGSTVDADMCGDTARIGGITTDDIVAVSTTGEGVRFYGPPEVAGDIATGGSTVRSNLYLTIPGTTMKLIDTGMIVAKDPTGEVNTTGAHALVDICGDDQTTVENAIAILNGLDDPAIEEGGNNGLKVGVGGSYTIDVTGDGVAVVDMDGLKVSHGASLTLKGNASDVIMLRVRSGRLKFGYGANLLLDGLVPENVLIYTLDVPRCRISPGVVGAGTVFCPEAGRFIIGAGVTWSGTFLGAEREVRVRKNAALTHVPFTGF